MAWILPAVAAADVHSGYVCGVAFVPYATASNLPAEEGAAGRLHVTLRPQPDCTGATDVVVACTATANTATLCAGGHDYTAAELHAAYVGLVNAVAMGLRGDFITGTAQTGVRQFTLRR